MYDDDDDVYIGGRVPFSRHSPDRLMVIMPNPLCTRRLKFYTSASSPLVSGAYHIDAS